MPPILEARDLTRSHRMGGTDVDAVRGVSLSVEPGEFVAVMGPSGSGKSTLLHLLGGLDRPTSGEVVLDGEVVSRLGDDAATKLRRAKTGFVFQFFNLVPILSVRENVALPFIVAGRDPNGRDESAAIAEVLAAVDLTGKERHRPDELSAGEQQRVALARALVHRPALLLADEPTGNLDYATGTEILDMLWRLCAERGQTVVLVTHDAKAAAYADRVLVLRDGTVLDEIALGRREDHAARSADRSPRRAGALTRARRERAGPAEPARPARPHRPDRDRDRARDRRARRGPGPQRRPRRRRGPERRGPRRAGPTCASPRSRSRASRPESVAVVATTPGVAAVAPTLERRTYPLAERGIGNGCRRRSPWSASTRAADPAVHDRRLAAGALLGTGDDDGALVSAELAREDGLGVGSTITLLGRSCRGPRRLPGRGHPRRDPGRPGPGPADGGRGPRSRPAPLRDRPGDGRRRPRRGRGGHGRRDRRARAPADRRAVHAEPRPPTSPPRCEAATAEIRATIALVAAVALFGGAFLIFNTLSMTVAERARDVGLLRAAGMTRRQVILMVLVSAAYLGVVGVALGRRWSASPWRRRPWRSWRARAPRSPS